MSSTSSETADTVIAVKRGKLTPIVCGLCLPAMVLLKMGFFLLALGMIPTLIALVAVRHSRNYIIGTVAAFNFAGVFPELLGIAMQGGTLRALLEHLSTPAVWASMYGAALLGWSMVWLSPTIAMLCLESFYRGRMRHMEYLQKKLEEEWGPEIRGREKS